MIYAKHVIQRTCLAEDLSVGGIAKKIELFVRNKFRFIKEVARKWPGRKRTPLPNSLVSQQYILATLKSAYRILFTIFHLLPL